MKALSHILVLVLLTLGSCTSSLYTGAEYDDLYYLASDKPVAIAKQSVNEQIAEGTLKAEDYYDNIYATDTLVSDQYSDAVDYDDQIVYENNNYGGGYDYNDNYPYSGRLRRFYGNYFDPYWRDPFYSNWGYPSFGYGFGYGGFPYSYNSYNPYYGYGGMYNDYYGGGYGGYGGYYGGGYGGYYGGGYGGYYGGGYGGYNGGYYLHNEGKNSVPYGRRERPSSLSSRWNSSVAASGSSRRDPYLSSGRNSDIGGRTSSGTQTISSDTRRTVSTNVNSQQAVNPTNRKLSQDPSKGDNIRTNTTTQRSSTNVRPEYNSVNRTYTPSYSNPRMSTRPSYNNSRVSDGVNADVNRNRGAVNNSRVYNNAGSVRTPSNSVRSNSSVNSVQRRAVSPSNNSVQYSVPTRRSAESGSGYSSGSYNNSSSGSRSSGSVSRSSSSSGSSSGTSSGSSSSSSSSSRSSSGRR